VVGYQNDTAPDSLKAAAEKAGFQEGNPGYEMRDNAQGQNDLAHKSNETAKKVAEQVGKSEKTVRRGSSQGIQVMRCEKTHGAKMTPVHDKGSKCSGGSK
jgi:hypothetical protein